MQTKENSINGTSALRREIIVIDPTVQEKSALKQRVAAYARVSSDSDDQLNSFAAQIGHYTDLFSSHEEWEMVDIYTDESITGTRADTRPDFQRMLRDCRKGKISRILTKSLSRFSRNTKDCLETLRELSTLGITVFFEKENIDTADMPSELI
ncbi:MAG: recombinase family protein, partial [Christensenella sp.]